MIGKKIGFKFKCIWVVIKVFSMQFDMTLSNWCDRGKNRYCLDLEVNVNQQKLFLLCNDICIVNCYTLELPSYILWLEKYTLN